MKNKKINFDKIDSEKNSLSSMAHDRQARYQAIDAIQDLKRRNLFPNPPENYQKLQQVIREKTLSSSEIVDLLMQGESLA